MGERRWVDPLLVAVLASAMAVVVTGMQAGYLDLPFGYDRDGLLHLALIQNQIESGSWLWGPRLAAPFGASNVDFPLGGERLSWVGLWILGRLTGDAATTANLWVLLSYPLVAVAGWWGARRFGLSRTSAVVVGLAFAFLPYHMVRQNAHLLRVAYVAVPWASWWIVRALDARPFEPAERRWLMVAAVAVACCDSQHAIFFAVLFGATALLTAVRTRRWTPILLSFALASVSATTLVVNNAPYVQARIAQGKNPVAGHRVVSEQERYGLRIAQMLLPTSGHRVPALARLKARSRVETLAKSEDGQSIGSLATLGLFAALFAALGVAAGLGSTPRTLPERPPEDTPDPSAILPRLGVVIVLAMLLGTGAGFSYLFSLGGLTMLRTWNRISVFIAFVALVAVGMLLDRLWKAFEARGWPVTASYGAAIAITALSLVDTTTPYRIPNHAFTRAAYMRDHRFFATVERGLGPNAMVAQWPVQRFPEPPDTHAMRAYDHLVGYLHTETVRWSYGGMAGRPAGNWADALDRFAPSTRAVILAAAGFDAIYVDRSGLEGGTVKMAKVERDIVPVVGPPIHTGKDARRALYDLRPLRHQLADDDVSTLAPDELAQLAAPVRVAWGRTFWDEEQRGGNTWRWSQRRGHIRLELDPGAAPQRVFFRAKLMSRAAPTGRVIVEGPGFSTAVDIEDQRGWMSLEVDVPEAGADLWLRWEGEAQSTSVGDRRTLSFRLINPVVYGSPRALELDCWARAHDPRREDCADR